MLLVSQRGLPDFLRENAVLYLIEGHGISLIRVLSEHLPGILVFAQPKVEFLSLDLEASTFLR